MAMCEAFEAHIQPRLLLLLLLLLLQTFPLYLPSWRLSTTT
jgi:hypothetical protein